MKTNFVNLIFSIAILNGGLFITSCSKNDLNTMQPQGVIAPLKSAKVSNAGIQSAIPSYYDSTLFTILFVEFPPKAEASLIAHNPGINFIYQSDPGLPGNQPFISVIDAIPGDGMNPVWVEVQIVFNPGFTPRQLFSDDEVLAAASGSDPEITLNTTDEVYFCPVIGHK